MKTIRHFLETLGLIAFIGIMAFLPVGRYDTLSFFACVIASIAILLFLGVYLIKNHSKGLFILLILTIGMSQNAMAGWLFNETKSDKQTEDFVKYIRQHGPEVCANKNTTPVAEHLITKAYYIKDMYGKLGLLDIDAWRDFCPWCDKSLDDYRHCAEDLISTYANDMKSKEDTMLLTVPMLMAEENGKCWPCGIVDTLLESVEKIAFSIEDYMKRLGLILLGIMTLFWLAFRILTFIGQMGMGGQDELMSDILRRLFVVLCTVAVLQVPLTAFTSIAISPFVSIGTGISNEISKLKLTNEPSFVDELGQASNAACSCCSDFSSTCDDGGSASQSTGIQKSTTRLFSEKDRADLLCATCRIYKQTLPFSISGQLMMRYSFKNKNPVSEFISAITGGASDYIPWPFPMYILGIVIVIVFTLFAFFAAFKLIDIFIRLSFVFILLPLLIAAYPFPISREYSKTGWEFFVHAILSLIALSIGMALVSLLFTSFLPGNAQNMLVPAMLGK